MVLVYRDGLPNALDGVSFVVRPGEKVGIVGRTGSGKSTLFLALFRLVELNQGQILLDGLDISAVGLAQLRSRDASSYAHFYCEICTGCFKMKGTKEELLFVLWWRPLQVQLGHHSPGPLPVQWDHPGEPGPVWDTLGPAAAARPGAVSPGRRCPQDG